MKNLIARLLRGTEPNPSPCVTFDAPRVPGQPFGVIGDIHGRADLLEQMVGLLADLSPDIPVVFVGDYIDRGDDSRAVLEMLSEPGRFFSRDTICLMGNHEAMCLSFLDDPAANGRFWIRNGGLQTMASFGVGGVGPGSGADEFAKARDALALAMGDRLIKWMRALPLIWSSGNVSVVHAAADPDLAMEEQPSNVLQWGHPEFARRNRSDGRWVVHGHTIVEQPMAENGRISVDTGAYATGRLTAAILREGDLEFRQTET
jgi:serine/threonine protein phosphatase 1